MNKIESETYSQIESVSFCYENKRALVVGLVALGVIFLIGSAIATWQMYSPYGDVAFTGLLLAVPAIGAFAAALCLPKERTVTKTEKEVAEPLETKRIKIVNEPPKAEPKFGKQLLHGHDITKSLYEIENYKHFEQPYAIVMGELNENGFSANNPPIVYFRRFEYLEGGHGRVIIRSGLPDARVPTKIIEQSGMLLLFYANDNNPVGYILESKTEDGPNGQKFVLASKA